MRQTLPAGRRGRRALTAADDDNPDLFFRNYRDTGCALHPACLTCPLPRCIEEERPERAALVAARAEGLTVAQVAALFGVSVRTVQRAARENGEGHGQAEEGATATMSGHDNERIRAMRAAGETISGIMQQLEVSYETVITALEGTALAVSAPAWLAHNTAAAQVNGHAGVAAITALAVEAEPDTVPPPAPMRRGPGRPRGTGQRPTSAPPPPDANRQLARTEFLAGRSVRQIARRNKLDSGFVADAVKDLVPPAAPPARRLKVGAPLTAQERDRRGTLARAEYQAGFSLTAIAERNHWGFMFVKEAVAGLLPDASTGPAPAPAPASAMAPIAPAVTQMVTQPFPTPDKAEAPAVAAPVPVPAARRQALQVVANDMDSITLRLPVAWCERIADALALAAAHEGNEDRAVALDAMAGMLALVRQSA